MRIELRFFLLLMFAAACGGDPDVGGNDGGSQPDGPLEIISFTTSQAKVTPNTSVELSWDVRGARVVEISTADSTLVSTFGQSGTVVAGPLRMTATYTLTAKRGSEMKTATLEIEVDWPVPEINNLDASPPVVGLGNFTTLTWSARDAEYLRLLKNGIETTRITRDITFGQIPVLVDAEETILEIEAVNPEHRASRSVTVRAEIPPTVVSFRVEPQIFFDETTTATVTWHTIGTTRTELINQFRVPINGFPGTVSGTVTLSLPRVADQFILVLYGSLGATEVFRRVGPPFFEMEPNNDITFANGLWSAAGASGELSTENDVDVYGVFPSFGASMKMWIAGANGEGCDTDTEIVFRSFSFELARDSDDGAPTARGGHCGALDPGTDPGLEKLFDGQYFVVISGSERGRYVLITQEL